MRYVVITWRVFYSVFLLRRLVVPHSEHRCEGTPLFFLRLVVAAFVNNEVRKRKVVS